MYLLTGKTTLCWAIWLTRNDVLDKCQPKTFMHVLLVMQWSKGLSLITVCDGQLMTEGFHNALHHKSRFMMRKLNFLASLVGVFLAVSGECTAYDRHSCNTMRRSRRWQSKHVKPWRHQPLTLAPMGSCLVCELVFDILFVFVKPITLAW